VAGDRSTGRRERSETASNRYINNEK